MLKSDIHFYIINIQMATYYIYKIACEDASVTDFYIGSSKNIRDRKSKHKHNCNSEVKKNYKIYQTIQANGGWSNWNMVVIEEILSTTLIGAKIREEYHRVDLKAQLNMRKAYTGLTPKEYQKQYKEDHKEELKKYKSEYNKRYREKIRQLKSL